MKIETREELINALMDAAELEHNLACMYLFAYFSLKKSEDEINGVPNGEKSQVWNSFLVPWQNSLRKIAKQEMGHLGTVCNLLTLIGAEAHYDRPNFPPVNGYYPTSAEITLERFNGKSLSRFVEFERNANLPGVQPFGLAPRDLSYNHVGELYAALIDAFNEIDNGGIPISNDELFLGYEKAVDRNYVSSDVEVHTMGLDGTPPTIKSSLRSKIREALFDVLEEGEGSSVQGSESHYQSFLKMANELKALLVKYPGFDPARPVPNNPMIQRHRDSANTGSLITDPLSKDIAEIFNSCYGSMLIALRQTFAFNENIAYDNAGKRRLADMHRLNVGLMRQTIGPLGDLLTHLPLSPGSVDRAGPGFEVYRPLYISTQPSIAWAVVAERIALAIAECQRLLSSSTDALVTSVLTNVQIGLDNAKAITDKLKQ